jgi:hypothetical protein
MVNKQTQYTALFWPVEQIDLKDDTNLKLEMCEGNFSRLMQLLLPAINREITKIKGNHGNGEVDIRDFVWNVIATPKGGTNGKRS